MGNTNSGSAPISGPNGQPQGQQGQQPSAGVFQNVTAKARGLFSSITNQPPPQQQPYNPGSSVAGGGKRRRHRKKVTTTLKKRTKKGSKTRKSAA